MKTKRYILSIALALAVINGKAQEIFVTHGGAVTESSYGQMALSLHTNGLYWLAAMPNIGAEIQTDWGVSLSLDYIGAWWNKRSSNHFYSAYGIQTELRYYPDALDNYAPYRGHHFGIYGQLLTYDFEFGGTGYQAPKFTDTYAVGLAYGYTKVLSRRLSLDFTVGLGYFRSKYSIYKPSDGIYYKTGTSTRTFFGPTRLEVNLVYNINFFNE